VELQGLEATFATTTAEAPERPALMRRLADGCAELGRAAQQDADTNPNATEVARRVIPYAQTMSATSSRGRSVAAARGDGSWRCTGRASGWSLTATTASAASQPVLHHERRVDGASRLEPDDRQLRREHTTSSPRHPGWRGSGPALDRRPIMPPGPRHRVARTPAPRANASCGRRCGRRALRARNAGGDDDGDQSQGGDDAMRLGRPMTDVSEVMLPTIQTSTPAS
jgi:hypothetical protein